MKRVSATPLPVGGYGVVRCSRCKSLWCRCTLPVPVARGHRSPLQEPTDAERIAALERRVAELERRVKPLDCIGPDSQKGRGKAGA